METMSSANPLLYWIVIAVVVVAVVGGAAVWLYRRSR